MKSSHGLKPEQQEEIGRVNREKDLTIDELVFRASMQVSSLHQTISTMEMKLQGGAGER